MRISDWSSDVCSAELSSASWRWARIDAAVFSRRRMLMTSTFSPRIIINGVGNVGRRLVRFCDAKGWPIVAAYNRAGEKVGKDVGELAGLDRSYGVEIGRAPV